MQKKIFALILIALAVGTFLAVRSATSTTNLLGVDWWLNIRPAAQQMMSGHSPYTVDGFFSPAWELIPLMPIANLPINLSIPILFIANLIAYIFVASRLGVNRIAMPFFVVLGGVLANSFYGNIEGLLMLGLLLPPWLSLIVLMCKPQIGIPVMLFFVGMIVFSGDALRVKAIRLFKLLLPITVCVLLSIALYGNWYTRAAGAVGKTWNTSPWPFGIPLGLWLIYMSIRKKDMRWSLMAIPFCTPYLGIITWAVGIMGLLAILPSPTVIHSPYLSVAPVAER